MAVLSTFRELSLCRQVHRELMRSTLLDLTPIISATVCHQRNYVERYSRYSCSTAYQTAQAVEQPENARFYDSARCVRELHAAVSNNSYPLLCTVNGRPHSCASLRYATIVPHPQTLPGGSPVLRATWDSP